MNGEQQALYELEHLLIRHLDGGGTTLDESALRTACSAAMAVAYPQASGAEHEMDVHRLLRTVLDAQRPAEGYGTAYLVTVLRDSVRRLRVQA